MSARVSITWQKAARAPLPPALVPWSRLAEAVALWPKRHSQLWPLDGNGMLLCEGTRSLLWPHSRTSPSHAGRFPWPASPPPPVVRVKTRLDASAPAEEVVCHVQKSAPPRAHSQRACPDLPIFAGASRCEGLVAEDARPARWLRSGHDQPSRMRPGGHAVSAGSARPRAQHERPGAALTGRSGRSGTSARPAALVGRLNNVMAAAGSSHPAAADSSVNCYPHSARPLKTRGGVRRRAHVP